MNIGDIFKKINEYFSPKVIASVNDTYVKVALIKGDDLPWHSHEDEDEFFYVLEGSLLMEEKEQSFIMNKGDFYTVKMGTKHRISSSKECKIMLIEKNTTKHTGSIKSKITKSIDEQLN